MDQKVSRSIKYKSDLQETNKLGSDISIASPKRRKIKMVSLTSP